MATSLLAASSRVTSFGLFSRLLIAGVSLMCAFFYYESNRPKEYYVILDFRPTSADGAIKSHSDTDNSLKLAFYIITSRFTDYKRVEELMELWGNTVRKHPYTHAFNFIEIENKELAEKYPTISLPESYKSYDQVLRPKKARWRESTELVKKSGYIMRHCVEATDAEWCFRFMDDTYVNLDSYNDFIRWLASHNNPREKVMVFGNCVNWAKDVFYLQGGTGYVFSRRAAEKFMKIEKEWIESLDGPEDNHIGDFLKAEGLLSTDVASSYFSGHFIGREEYHRFEWDPTRNDKYPPCPDPLPEQPECNSTLTPYSKTVFSHSWGNRLSHRDWQNWFNKVPKDAMIYYHGMEFRVCKGKLQ